MSMMAKAFASYKRDGARGLVVSVCQFLIRYFSRSNASGLTPEESETNFKPTIDLSSRYWFVNDSSFGQNVRSGEIDPKTINWIIPDFQIPSGGHLTVFRLIRDLELLGFKNRVAIEHPLKVKTAEQERTEIADHFLPINCPISFGVDSLQPAHFTFATNWSTAYLLKNFQSTIEKCYLVQDYEPYFYPASTEHSLAAHTYDFGFKTFASGNWLAHELQAKHNVNAHVFGFACDKALYALKRDWSNLGNTRKLLFYTRPSTPRRGFELGMVAIEKLLEKHKNVQAILAGCDLSAFELPAGMESVGIVPLAKLPELYSKCDAALVISFTNISLLPLDLMTNGCAVISNSGPQVEWLLNDEIAMLAKPDPDSLYTALEKILIDDNLRQVKVNAAYHFIADHHWTMGAKLIADTLLSEQTSYLKQPMSIAS